MIDRTLLQLAGGQFGVVGYRQLTERLGMSKFQISRARGAGLLVDVMPGVLRLASSADAFEGRCMALQLASGGHGFLSGPTAARLHGIRKMPTTPVHFTIPPGHTITAPDWARVHVTSWYGGEVDRIRLDSGLLVATPLRTLFGLAARFNSHRFERAAEDAWHLGLVTPSDAADYLERHRCRGKDGVRTMELWLEKALGTTSPAQSDLERDVLDALARVGLPTPVRQHPITLPSGETIHLDIAWPDIRLAVEPGGNWWHGGDLGQRKDQSRDLAAAEVGWQIVRVDEHVRDDLMGAARRIRRLFRERSRLFPTDSAQDR